MNFRHDFKHVSDIELFKYYPMRPLNNRHLEALRDKRKSIKDTEKIMNGCQPTIEEDILTHRVACAVHKVTSIAIYSVLYGLLRLWRWKAIHYRSCCGADSRYRSFQVYLVLLRNTTILLEGFLRQRR